MVILPGIVPRVFSSTHFSLIDIISHSPFSLLLKTIFHWYFAKDPALFHKNVLFALSALTNTYSMHQLHKWQFESILTTAGYFSLILFIWRSFIRLLPPVSSHIHTPFPPMYIVSFAFSIFKCKLLTTVMLLPYSMVIMKSQI